MNERLGKALAKAAVDKPPSRPVARPRQARAHLDERSGSGGEALRGASARFRRLDLAVAVAGADVTSSSSR